MEATRKGQTLSQQNYQATNIITTGSPRNTRTSPPLIILPFPVCRLLLFLFFLFFLFFDTSGKLYDTANGKGTTRIGVEARFPSFQHDKGVDNWMFPFLQATVASV